jgi:hypothetical protein
MAYSKAKLKSSGDSFSSFWIGKLLGKYLPIQILLYVSSKHILISLTSFMGTPDYIRILYNTFLLNES